MEEILFNIFNRALEYNRDGGRGSLYDNAERDFISFSVRHANISNSQLFQDLWVLYELGMKQDGYFVEFGACDGVELSNTLILEKMFGWTGIVADPAKIWHTRLYENRNCFISRKCVYSETGKTVTFNETRSKDLSTIDEYSNADTHADNRIGGDLYDVVTVSLKDLLLEAAAPKEIDYMSIDTEGSELEILAAFDFSAYDIKLISVEHNYSSKRLDIYDLLAKNGYRRMFPKLSQWDDWYSKISVD